jgi:hypothetical protein
LNCPICNKDNKCGVEADQAIDACWCSKTVFPKELIAQLSEKQQGKSCICKACLDKWITSLEV